MPLITMKNISREMQWKLITVGIESSKSLRDVGSRASFAKLKKNYPELDNTNVLVLQGAIDDCHYDSLSPKVIQELLTYAKALDV